MAGDGTAVAGHFFVGPDLRWEVGEHLHELNGTEDALHRSSAIAAYVWEVHANGEVWMYVGVAAPDGTPQP